MTQRRGPVEKCTFCSKGRSAVENLIAGPPGINICNECVELCNTILLEELKRAGRPAKRKRRPREGAGTMREEGALRAPREIMAHLDQYVVGHVSRMLCDGARG